MGLGFDSFAAALYLLDFVRRGGESCGAVRFAKEMRLEIPPAVCCSIRSLSSSLSRLVRSMVRLKGVLQTWTLRSLGKYNIRYQYGI